MSPLAAIFFFFIESLLSDARNPVARRQQNIALIKLSWKPMKHADDMLLHLNPAPNWVSQPRLTWVCLLPCEHSVGHSCLYHFAVKKICFSSVWQKNWAVNPEMPTLKMSPSYLMHCHRNRAKWFSSAIFMFAFPFCARSLGALMTCWLSSYFFFTTSIHLLCIPFTYFLTIFYHILASIVLSSTHIFSPICS